MHGRDWVPRRDTRRPTDGLGVDPRTPPRRHIRPHRRAHHRAGRRRGSRSRRGGPARADHRRRAGGGDRDRPPSPPGDAAGPGRGAPGAGPRPARRRHPEHLQRHPDRGGAAGGVRARPGRGHAQPGAAAPARAGGARRDAHAALRAPAGGAQTAPLDVLVERLGDALSGQTDTSVDVRVDRDLDLPPDVKVVALPRHTGGVQQHRQARARLRGERARRAAGDG